MKMIEEQLAQLIKSIENLKTEMNNNFSQVNKTIKNLQDEIRDMHETRSYCGICFNSDIDSHSETDSHESNDEIENVTQFSSIVK